MRKWIWTVAVATVAVCVTNGLTLAQAPAPMPMTPAPAAQAAPAQTLPAAPATVHAPATTVYAPAVGCADGGCAPAAPAKHRLLDKLLIGSGTANPIGCGCCASEKTFFFGSCNQFFTPGKRCDGSPTLYNCTSGTCGGLWGNKQRCPLPTYAQPYGQVPNNCAGPFTYLNR